MRRVKTGRLVKDLRVVEDGLTRNEKIIVSGVQRARPGAPVTPTFAAMESLKTALDRGELSTN
jgi:multidrug efflux system membrane fusion protein